MRVYVNLYAAAFQKSIFYLLKLFFCNHTKLEILDCTFWKICRKKFKIYPETFIEPKYGKFHSNNKVKVQTLSFVQLVESSSKIF